MDKVEVLKRSDVFRELNNEQLRLVAQMCTAEVFEPGTVIHRQNTVLDKLRVIEEGLVAIVLEVGALSHRQVTAAANFESIGWSAIVPPYLTTTSARAMERTKVLTFKGHDLVNLCQTNPGIACLIYRGVARVIADRLCAAFIQCLGVTAQD